MTNQLHPTCEALKISDGFKNKPGRKKSVIPLAVRTKIYSARAKLKLKKWLDSHPAAAALAKEKHRAWQRIWRRKNLKRCRINSRRQYWRRAAKNPNHRTRAQWRDEQKKYWSEQPKKWSTQAARSRDYRIREGEAIRIRDRARRARGIKNLADWFVRHLLAKSTGLKRRNITDAMIRRKRKALLNAAAKKLFVDNRAGKCNGMCNS